MATLFYSSVCGCLCVCKIIEEKIVTIIKYRYSSLGTSSIREYEYCKKNVRKSVSVYRISLFMCFSGLNLFLDNSGPHAFKCRYFRSKNTTHLLISEKKKPDAMNGK